MNVGTYVCMCGARCVTSNSCTGGRAKSEMGVSKRPSKEFDCVLVLSPTFPIRRATPKKHTHRLIGRLDEV